MNERAPIGDRGQPELPPVAAGDRLTVSLQVPPVFMSAELAAAYLGIGVTLFRAMVADGRLPGPVEIGGKKGATGRGVRSLWYRPALDAAAHAIVYDAGDGELVA